MQPFELILPIALNPALDFTLQVDGLVPEQINCVLAEHTDAAGKAVNVAKALHALGVESRTLIVAGDENADRYFRVLDGCEAPISYKGLLNPGSVRENLHIMLPDSRLVTVRRSGFRLTRDTLSALESEIREQVRPGTLVMLCGRHPDGFGSGEFLALCNLIRDLGGKLALDSNSIGFDEIRRAAPWIIKPNLEELSQYLGRALPDEGAIFAALTELHSAGAEHILLSMGADGLLYYGGSPVRCIRVKVPPVKMLSPVGAGDSTLAGFVAGVQASLPIDETVRLAASAGTAAVLLPGTKPPDPADVRTIFLQTTASELA